MLLAIDIGNTNISFGIFTGKKIIKRFSLATKVIQRRRGRLNVPYLKRNLSGVGIDDVIISSVVPKAAKVLEQDLKKLLGKKPYIIGKDVKVPIRNLYRQPQQVGQDRLVNVFAGSLIYGAPLIVVDFGTAITFDVISRHKAYLGGMILPGLEISLAALSEKTALLPKIKLDSPKELIGGDTKSSMLSGIVYGFAALTDELVTKIKHKIGNNAKVIGTGGNINLISKYCQQFDKIDRDLTLKGLNLVYGMLGGAQ